MNVLSPQSLSQYLSSSSGTGSSSAVETWPGRLLAQLQSESYAPGGKRRRDAIVSVPGIFAEVNAQFPMRRALQCWEGLSQLVSELAADPWSEVRVQMAATLVDLLNY